MEDAIAAPEPIEREVAPKPEKPKISVERQLEMAPLLIMAQTALAAITIEELEISLRMARDVASSYQAFGCLLDPSNSRSKTMRHEMIVAKMEAFRDLRKAMAMHDDIDQEVASERNTAALVSHLFG